MCLTAKHMEQLFKHLGGVALAGSSETADQHKASAAAHLNGQGGNASRQIGMPNQDPLYRVSEIICDVIGPNGVLDISARVTATKQYCSQASAASGLDVGGHIPDHPRLLAAYTKITAGLVDQTRLWLTAVAGAF
jgi:hypothetical protein